MCRIYEYKINYKSLSIFIETKEKEELAVTEETKVQEQEPDDGYKPPKNMPQSVRGNKRIDFSFKGNKPLCNILYYYSFA